MSLYGTGMFNIANVVEVVETTGPLNISGEILSSCKILSSLQTASQFLKILNIFPCYVTQQDPCKYTHTRETKTYALYTFYINRQQYIHKRKI